MPECKKCGKPIIWRKHVNSRQNMPIDLVPVAGGNLAVLDGENYAVVPRGEAATRVDLHKSPDATCSNPEIFRKPKP